MKTAQGLAPIFLAALVAAPLAAFGSEGVIRGSVDCGKRCGKIMVYLDGVEGAYSGDS